MSSDDRIPELTRRKRKARAYLRSLSAEEKILKLIDLQERYYEMLSIREANGGRPIPEKWQKWYTARYTKRI